jgi:hypothetical protein
MSTAVVEPVEPKAKPIDPAPPADPLFARIVAKYTTAYRALSAKVRAGTKEVFGDLWSLEQEASAAIRAMSPAAYYDFVSEANIEPHHDSNRPITPAMIDKASEICQARIDSLTRVVGGTVEKKKTVVKPEDYEVNTTIVAPTLTGVQAVKPAKMDGIKVASSVDVDLDSPDWERVTPTIVDPLTGTFTARFFKEHKAGAKLTRVKVAAPHEAVIEDPNAKPLEKTGEPKPV